MHVIMQIQFKYQSKKKNDGNKYDHVIAFGAKKASSDKLNF